MRHVRVTSRGRSREHRVLPVTCPVTRSPFHSSLLSPSSLARGSPFSSATSFERMRVYVAASLVRTDYAPSAYSPPLSLSLFFSLCTTPFLASSPVTALRSRFMIIFQHWRYHFYAFYSYLLTFRFLIVKDFELVYLYTLLLDVTCK